METQESGGQVQVEGRLAEREGGGPIRDEVIALSRGAIAWRTEGERVVPLRSRARRRHFDALIGNIHKISGALVHSARRRRG